MDKYKVLKSVLHKEKQRLHSRLRELDGKSNRLAKIRKVVDVLLDLDIDDFDHEKLYRLKKNFPDLEELFTYYRKAIDYRRIVNSYNIDDLDLDDFDDTIIKCHDLYGFPPMVAINDIKKTTDIIRHIKSKKVREIDLNEMNILLGKKEGRHMLHAYVSAFCDTLSMELMHIIVDYLEKEEKIDVTKEIDEIKENLDLINRFNPMFSDTDMLSKFSSSDEFKSFADLVTPLLTVDECIELFKNIKIDQGKVEEEVIKVDFDNLDMSIFNEEEKRIIKNLREIIEDEDLKGDAKVLENVPVTYNDRINAYKNVSIPIMLLDVEHNLLNKIYDNKEEIISIFKTILDLYRKDIVFKIRVERMKELQRIRDDFNNIISFINRTYLDKNKAYQEVKEIDNYIKSINTEYLPFIIELLNSDIEDESYDDEIDLFITNLKTIVKKWKIDMTEYYQDDKNEEDVKENTDNLVFCLTDDIDLKEEGYQKEFVGTIEALELKTSRELKKGPGRKGMTRLRKATENDKSIDFVKYLETRNKIRLHFVPYRYSNGSNYRTGLIKFEPSTKVKEFLEERYGLSKQSACYGVFMIITSIGADHSEYSRFQDYILNNYEKIEEMALLFASDKPDYNKLIDVIDKLLKIKKDKLIVISNDLKI